jgi:LuxR family maltose regulon positive regulatory protein
MPSSLLTTKQQIPPQPPQGVPRPRLTQALENNLSHYKLVLLTAPAGYGKTTLLAQWAHQSHFPVAWLSLDEADNDLERFVHYLLASWETVQPEIREGPLGPLLEAKVSDSEAVLTSFINAANQTADPVAFVLDDYHLIEDPAIHTALTFLLDHLPPTLHLILAGRSEPPLPLARYRARRELLTFGPTDLQFLPEETQTFLTKTMSLALNQADLLRLQNQLEGWVAGLQLVALTLGQRLTETDKVVVTGRHRFIADYLQDDVLSPLPEQQRQFLLQTSILDQLCGPLSNAVTGRDDGQVILETLERANLFLRPLDDSRIWFRYHPLFADFLHEILKQHHPTQVTDLHHRAGRWYFEQDDPDPAFRHAVDGHDVELVLHLFERYTQARLIGGEFKRLKHWLDALPEAWQTDYPLIGIIWTAYFLFTGRLDAGVRCLDEVEQQLATTAKADLGSQLAWVKAVRCAIACFQNDLPQAESLAGQAFQDLSADDHFFQAIIYGSLGDTYRRNSRWTKAKECYVRLLDFIHAPAFQLQAIHVFGALADLDLRQGHLRDAAGYWQKALTAIRERSNWGRLPLPLTGWVYIRLAELHYEWNELAEAREHLARGLERAELGDDIRAMIAGYLIGGQLKLTDGDLDSAAAYLEQARPLVEQAQFSHWISRFERFQLTLWLAQDRLRTAVIWSDQMLADQMLTERPESEGAQLAIAYVLIIKGDPLSLERALALLKALLQTAQDEDLLGIQIESLLLQALAQWHLSLGNRVRPCGVDRQIPARVRPLNGVVQFLLQRGRQRHDA